MCNQLDVKEFQKFVVKSVNKNQKNGVQSVELNTGQFLELRQTWYSSIIEVGDSILVKTNETTIQDVISITDKTGFVVINPNILVTITDLSSFSFCQRKTWLNSRFKIAGSDSNKAFTIGDLVHCLFQETINDTNPSKQTLFIKLKQLIKNPSVLRSLLILNIEEQEIIDECKEYIDSILLFNRKYNSGVASHFDSNQPNLKLKINKVTDIEDTVIAPNYGLKGKVDLTMDVEIHDSRTKTIKQTSTPFELKSGKVSFSFSHQGQISLYALMLDKQSNPVKFGLLAYLKGGVNMKYVTINDYIKHSLIMQRNDLVHYLKYLKNGPETRSNLSFCGKCDHLFDCCLMGKIYEPEKLENFNSFDIDLLNSLSHLSEQEIEFFKEWVDMIYIEENNNRLNSNVSCSFWDKEAIELEKKDQAIAKLTLHEFQDDSYEYVFKRSSSYKSLGPLPVNVQFIRNVDKITLSIENEAGQIDKIGFVNGSIKKIDENYVTVLLDEKINDKFIKKTFRLDILPVNQNYSYMYSSVLRLLNKNENSAFLRDLIIKKRKPTFKQLIISSQLDLVKKITKNLNPCQQKAVLNVLKMDDYLLIKGDPGAGKTETIVHIVKLLAQLKRTVIITAHTNQAVDNILLKLMKEEIPFMRIGRESRMNSEIRPFSESNLLKDCSTTQEIKKLYSSINVFAGTCFSINSHLIFKLKEIEYCIVDEASQISLPENLLPLFDCKKFILVGDPQQLPPIVRSVEAKKAGLETTLFSLLMNKINCIELTIQYRMNKEIMRIANYCTYENRLTTGSQKIANATLNLEPDLIEIIDSDITIECSTESWLSKCLSNKIDLSVVFLDTDGKQAEHETDGNGEIYNMVEVNTILKILRHLIEKKFPVEEIGIITPYQRQVRTIREFTKRLNVEVSTIDQYQGRDKSVILISCVKSKQTLINPESAEILNDSRRLNVAQTRAKNKLIVIGSKKTLKNYKPFERFFECLNENQILRI